MDYKVKTDWAERYSILLQQYEIVPVWQFSDLAGKFFDDIMADFHRETSISFGWKWVGYGTWRSACHVSKWYYGEELAKVISRSFSGTITHNEDDGRELEDMIDIAREDFLNRF